jgi:hypothetical protein
MAHRLNTNKQFMIGNGILAFAVIFAVVIFVYMSFRLKRRLDAERYYPEVYTVSLAKGFVGDSLSIYVNDSLMLNQRIAEEPFTFEFTRFEEQSTLMIVDNSTDRLSSFGLSDKGGSISLVKEEGGIKQKEVVVI